MTTPDAPDAQFEPRTERDRQAVALAEWLIDTHRWLAGDLQEAWDEAYRRAEMAIAARPLPSITLGVPSGLTEAGRKSWEAGDRTATNGLLP